MEDAAHLLAYWQDLQSVEPHELRGHLALSRMLCAFYQGLGLDGDWHLTASFQVPMTSQPLVVTALVGHVGAETRATMREGNPKDIQKHYPAPVLREHLEQCDLGILSSWAVWGNAYFLHAIRDALFKPGKGVAWKALDAHPNARTPHLARQALRPGYAPTAVARRHHILDEPGGPRVDEHLAKRCQLVWKRVGQLSVRIPPQNVPLDEFQRRNPPPGVPRKGNALTLTEFLCSYLVRELGMNFTEAAERLGMDDWRQARRAVEKGDEKQASWSLHRS